MCAEELGLTKAEVGAVATFYTMYRRRPAGEYHVGVCTNTLCAVLGGDAILDRLKDHLGIGHNETTEDGTISLEHIECNAACDYAPVVMVNWEFYDNQTPASARELVDALPRRQPAAAHPRAVDAVHLQAGLARARRLPRRPGERGRAGRSGHARRPRARQDARRRRARHARPEPAASTRARTPDVVFTPVLSRHWDDADSFTIDSYTRHGGYTALPKALAMDPDALIALVKESGLRGRGGAGFPTGMKWGFIPQGTEGQGAKPHYLVVNADESEPGTCKDTPFLMANPHALVEGVAIASYAIRVELRGHLRTRRDRPRHPPAAAGRARRLRRRPPRQGHRRHAASTSTSSCTPAPAPTSAARRRRCSTPSRATAASRGCARRSRRRTASTPARPS